MKQRYALIVISILILFGSFANFYTTNFLLSDVSNLTFGITNRPVYIFASLPGLNFSLIVVALTIFFIRAVRRPEYIKRLLRLYAIITMSFSFIGLVSAIISGIAVYKTFTAENPFPGYLIISIIFFTVTLAAGALYFILWNKKIPEDKGKRKMKASYVFYSIMLGITTYYAYNRLGSLMWSVSYADEPTLFMTWPFYFSLVLPILMFAHTNLYSFNFYKKYNGVALIIISIITALFIITTIYTISVGMINTTFISVISPAMGASRLLAKPIDIIFHFIVFGVVDVYALQHSIRYYLSHKGEPKQAK